MAKEKVTSLEEHVDACLPSVFQLQQRAEKAGNVGVVSLCQKMTRDLQDVVATYKAALAKFRK